MNAFAALLDRLAYEPSRTGKLALLERYFRTTADPDRGWALAAMTGALSFRNAKPNVIRKLVARRVDPLLFELSYDFVGDLAETVALIWPAETRANAPLTLDDVVTGLGETPKAALEDALASWLDRLDETGRWALLKLVTGALRVGVSARLARSALARLGEYDAEAIEDVWHADAPPYLALFAWIEGRGPRPSAGGGVRFFPPMLAHAIEPADFAGLDPADFAAEWKWDGIRVEAVRGRKHDGSFDARLFSRAGEDITAAFPDLVETFNFEAAIDGELVVRREGRIADFNSLQKRLNRKSASDALAASHPAHVRAYDLLSLDGEDLRALAFAERRARLERFLAAAAPPRIDLSPLIPFATFDALAAARADPAGAGVDAPAVEGVMLKRRDSPYVAGRQKGLWFKWKRDPMTVDAVLMYAQRGSGKRSSFYSDYTFGVWRDGALTPVGKAYFGFSDEELVAIDRFVRNNTVKRFGPVREVTHDPEKGLVFEVAFEGLQRSARHKSGIAMRFPRIARLRWDKPPRDADSIETLLTLLKD